MVAAKKTATARAAGEPPPLTAALQRSQDVIDRFLDGLWLEDGLAKNSLAAFVLLPGANAAEVAAPVKAGLPRVAS